ncbi:hypothetical protein, partial [Acidovorax sp. T1m]
MNLWIDTTGATRAEPLYGIPPVERLRRSVKHLDAGVQVVLSGVDAGRTAWPAARPEVDTAALGARLRQALAGGA